MSNFYLNDPNIVINGNLKPLEYRIYSYCCSQFNVKKMSAFIRIVNIGGQFQKTKEEVEEILISLSKIRLYERELISIKDGPKYIIFDMPAHKYFLENIGFKKGDFPNAESYYESAISIPLFHTMTSEQQDQVVAALEKVLK